MANYSLKQLNMIHGQISVNGITCPDILNALISVPRELFTIKEGVSSYFDEDIELKNGRFLIEPLTLAKMLNALNPTKADLALNIACGYGYTSAVLAKLVGKVIKLDNHESLTDAAKQKLNKLDINNFHCVDGELDNGAEEYGKYSLITIFGLIEDFPTNLYKQLKNGGKAIFIKKIEDSLGEITLVTVQNGEAFSEERIERVTCPEIKEFAKKKGFKF